MLNGLTTYGLLFIGQHWQTVTPDPARHYNEMDTRLRKLAKVRPLFINSQTGKDHFSFEENKKLLLGAEDIANETGISIVHETHRGKFSFAGHVTKHFLEKMPSLRITLDISHWCNTAESLLNDQQEAVALAVSHTDHIHARIGHPQGPQITDPRDPSWKEAVEFHFGCWDKVVALKKAKQETLTITPEFGPHPYMARLPFTHQAIADQWDINRYMMNVLRERYAHEII